MKLILSLALAVLTVTATCAEAQTAESWSPVTAREDTIRAVNVPSVTITGNRRTFETLDVYAASRMMGTTVVDYSLGRHQVDCADKTTLMLGVRGFLADGTQVISAEAPANRQPQPVRERSIGAETLDVVCGDKWMVVQYRSVDGFLNWARREGIAEWNDPDF